MRRSQEECGGRRGRSPQQMRKLSIIAVLSLLVVALAATAAFAVDSTTFNMVRSQTAVDNDCLEGARAHVDVLTTATDQAQRGCERQPRPGNRGLLECP